MSYIDFLIEYIKNTKTGINDEYYKLCRIDKIGFELEGYFENQPETEGNFIEDGSLSFTDLYHESECDGSCSDECYCFDYCECEECFVCNHCNYAITDCHCNECLICVECLYRLDMCECKIERDEDCSNKNCNDHDICDECLEYWRDNQETRYDCNECENTSYNCERDCSCECQCECSCQKSGVGEFVSNPMKVGEIKDWLYSSYPDKTNLTCGGHFHISLKHLSDYISLMDKKFYDYYISNMIIWGKKMKINEGSHFWKRIDGQQFCYRDPNPIDQRRMRGKYDQARYKQINYCYNVLDRKTIEFRLLPAFQKDYLYVSAVLESIRLIEDYLLNLPKTKTVKMEIVV